MSDENVTIEEQPPVRRARPWARIGIFFSTIALVIIICAFSVGYFQLVAANQIMARLVEQLSASVNDNQQEMMTWKQTVETLQQDAINTQTLAKQQEQIQSEWHAAQKGDLAKWHVAEAYYLVKLANDHVQFDHDFNLALILLQRAEKILESLADPQFLELRKAVATEIANLQATPQIDMTALYLRLNALDKQMNELPLPFNPVKPGEIDNSALKLSADLPWWQRGWQHTLHALKQVVIVRNIGGDSLPLVMPEQKNFLYLNLHSQMESVMWATLHRNQPIYSTSLANVMTWVKTYFDQTSPLTQQMSTSLLALQNVDITLPAVNFSKTLALFETFLNSTEPKQAAGQ